MITSKMNESKQVINKSQFKIIGKEFVSYYDGYSYVISNGELEFVVFESEDDVKQICDYLNKKCI